MHFSRALIRVSENSMSVCSDALDAALKAGVAQAHENVAVYELRDGFVMRVHTGVEILRLEKS